MSERVQFRIASNYSSGPSRYLLRSSQRNQLIVLLYLSPMDIVRLLLLDLSPATIYLIICSILSNRLLGISLKTFLFVVAQSTRYIIA